MQDDKALIDDEKDITIYECKSVLCNYKKSLDVWKNIRKDLIKEIQNIDEQHDLLCLPNAIDYSGVRVQTSASADGVFNIVTSKTMQDLARMRTNKVKKLMNLERTIEQADTIMSIYRTLAIMFPLHSLVLNKLFVAEVKARVQDVATEIHKATATIKIMQDNALTAIVELFNKNIDEIELLKMNKITDYKDLLSSQLIEEMISAEISEKKKKETK